MKETRAFTRTRGLVILYILLRLIVIYTLIRQFMLKNYFGVFQCVLTLILFMLPSVVDHSLHLKLPTALEVTVIVFMFAANILGEINEYYIHIKHWDSILHTTSGFMLVAVSFALIDLFNQTPHFHVELSPIYVAIAAICMAVTFGVVWEFFEYFMDVFFRTDMQKDTVVKTISSVALHPDGRNTPVVVAVESVVVNGEAWPFDGYLDIGLHDTMKDMLLNFAGALFFTIFGYAYLRGRDNRIARNFIPELKTEEEIADDHARIDEWMDERKSRWRSGGDSEGEGEGEGEEKENVPEDE